MLTETAYAAGYTDALEKFAVNARDYLKLTGTSLLGGQFGQAKDFLRQAWEARKPAPAPTGNRPQMPVGGFQNPNAQLPEEQTQVMRASDEFLRRIREQKAQRNAGSMQNDRPVIGKSGLPQITAAEPSQLHPAYNPSGNTGTYVRPQIGSDSTGVLPTPQQRGSTYPTQVGPAPSQMTLGPEHQQQMSGRAPNMPLGAGTQTQIRLWDQFNQNKETRPRASLPR